MKTLVTGATGFIGSHLVEELLKRGHSVACLVRKTSNLQWIDGLNVRLIYGDCTIKESLLNAVADFDYIFHLAGLTKAYSEEDYYNANVKGTENIVRAVVEKNPEIKRFVYLSSLAAAGPSHDGIPLKEDCEMRPVSLYGKTKLEGEKIVVANGKNIPCTVIRPPAVYGPRDRDLLVFFRMVKLGVVPYWGKCYYSFLYVEDLINGIILAALNKEAAGEIFFLTDGKTYSSDDIIEAISAALRKKPLKLVMPKFVMPILGFISEKAKGLSIINADRIKDMKYSHWICDTHKANVLLKYKPNVGIKEGVKWTADWYRIHQWL